MEDVLTYQHLVFLELIVNSEGTDPFRSEHQTIDMRLRFAIECILRFLDVASKNILSICRPACLL